MSETEGAASAAYRRVLLKLSGEAFAGGGAMGVDPPTVRAIAETGVDLISAGALTQNSRTLDLGLDIEVGAPGAGVQR